VFIRVKFLFDSMLTKTGRMFRIMGYDVKIAMSSSKDEEILEEAKRENRILVTRDKSLYRKSILHGLRVIYSPHSDQYSILRDIAHSLGIKLRIDLSKTRCARCNQPLKVRLKEEIPVEDRKLIPEGYWTVFYCCRCRRPYWLGSHYSTLIKILDIT